MLKPTQLMFSGHPNEVGRTPPSHQPLYIHSFPGQKKTERPLWAMCVWGGGVLSQRKMKSGCHYDRDASKKVTGQNMNDLRWFGVHVCRVLS